MFCIRFDQFGNKVVYCRILSVEIYVGITGISKNGKRIFMRIFLQRTAVYTFEEITIHSTNFNSKKFPQELYALLSAVKTATRSPVSSTILR